MLPAQAAVHAVRPLHTIVLALLLLLAKYAFQVAQAFKAA